VSTHTEVRLIRNPWTGILNDGVVLQYLQTSVIEGAEWLQDKIAADEIKPDRNSYGGVILDPTCQRVTHFRDRVMAVILIGPDAKRFVPNGAAKADAADRHSMGTSYILNEEHPSYHMFGFGDFAWGGSVSVEGAVAGGSGLSVKQDEQLMELIVSTFIEKVNRALGQWLRERRQRADGQAWWTPDNQPGTQYVDVLGLPAIVPTDEEDDPDPYWNEDRN
jgi:hypothetical protein